MQPTTIFIIAAAIANSVKADVPVTRALHLADFRMYSNSGCDGGNLGIVAVHEGDVGPGVCSKMGRLDVKSVSTVDINTNCKLYFFTDDECTAGKMNVTWKQCYGSLDGIKGWTIECD